MNYYYEEKTVLGKPMIIIGIEGKENIGLEDFLNDSELDLKLVLEKLNSVISGKSDQEEVGSERSVLEIKAMGSEIYDQFEGIVDAESLNPIVKISNEELRDIILDWQMCKQKFYDAI